MKTRIAVIIFLASSLPIIAWAWWRDVDNETVVLEKGDSLWKVAHSLYGAGWNYPLLWNGRLDSVSSNPSLVYPGMRFRLPESHINKGKGKQHQSLDRVVAVGERIAASLDHISKRVDSLQALGTEINEGVNPGFGKSIFDLFMSILSDVISTLAADMIKAIAAGVFAKIVADFVQALIGG